MADNPYIQVNPVAWRTKASSVYQLTRETLTDPATYRVTVRVIDTNDFGDSTIAVGYYLKDYLGHTYNILDYTSTTIDVEDSFRVGYAPTPEKDAIVYRSIDDNSPYLAGIFYRFLSQQALEYSRQIEMSVMWKSKLSLDQTNPQSVINGSPIMEGIQFDTTPTTTNVAEGLLRWNPTDRTLNLGMGDGGIITQQIGQELFIMGVNKTASILSEGKVVYINGRQGLRPKFELAKSDSDSTSSAIGVVTETIAVNAEGFATTFGYVRGIKTDYTGTGIWGTTWSEGDILWVSKTTAGQLTNVQQTVPNHSDIVGTVGVIHGTQGSIFVSISKHKTLEELSDVNGTPLTTDGQFPNWNNTNKCFDFDKNINDYLPLRAIEDTKGITGFVNPSDIDVSYNWTNRTITLTGVLDYYWRGELHTLTSPWTSPVHANSVDQFMLYSTDGVNFEWSNDMWEFSDCMVSFVNRKSTAELSFAICETHGTMDHLSHEENHQVNGTYLLSGGKATAGTYTLNTATNAANSPGFDAARLKDEDRETNIAALLEGTYTTMYIGASSAVVFNVAATLPFTSAGSYIQFLLLQM